MPHPPLVVSEESIRRNLPHLSASDAALLTEVVRCLVAAYEPEQIFLFGSKARGDAGPDSDFDLMVVVPDTALPERQQSGLAYAGLWEIGTAADVLVWRSSRFSERLSARASLPATILREGALLYAA